MTIRALILLLLCGAPLFSQTAENVLLVVNDASAVSMEVGSYYAQKRGIPQSNVLRIKTTTDDSISREDFERQIESPIASWLTRNSAQDSILYIVLTKGIPLRIEGTTGKKNATTASVDSELALLYREMALGQKSLPAGPVENPYFLGEVSLAQAAPFTHRDQDIYLICRLDGYDSEDIQGLIDRGFAPSKEGKILLDAKGSPAEIGNAWIQAAADRLSEMGFGDRVVLEKTSKVLTGIRQVLGYYSWGSNDPAIRMRHFGFEFVPGALAGMFVSSDARTFRTPPADWNVGGWDDKNTRYAGSPQSLAADIIHDGVTGISGHVAEPFLEATIRPDILFPAYMAGFSLIESYYLAMPYLSWQTVVVGDPLCAPFRTKHLAAEEIDKGLDPETELPGFFSTRRVRAISVTTFKQAGVHPDTVKLILRAESRLARQDREGARKDLEEATARDNRLPGPLFILANLNEAAEEYDKAIANYRRLIELVPKNPLFLNNLAYALAVRKNNVQEALPMAEEAYKLAKENPNIKDTLGWIYHLAGQNEKAMPLLEEAVKSASRNAEMNLHFAVISAEMGDMLAAEVALLRAIEIDPKMEQREEVLKLRSILKQQD
jgi:uncharacterized protein (TIGR03790 family)